MSESWENVKEAFKKPATPEAMKEAAEALAQYQKTSLGKSNSRPTLVTLATKGIPNAVPVDQISNQVATDPEYYKFMQKIIARER